MMIKRYTINTFHTITFPEGETKDTDVLQAEAEWDNVQTVTPSMCQLYIIQIMNGYECNGTDIFMR